MHVNTEMKGHTVCHMCCARVFTSLLFAFFFFLYRCYEGPFGLLYILEDLLMVFNKSNTRGLSGWQTVCALVPYVNLIASLSNLSSCPSFRSTPSPSGCSVAGSSKVKLMSNTGGVFGVFWHLGERFQLIWNPCVHFNGFSGE